MRRKKVYKIDFAKKLDKDTANVEIEGEVTFAKAPVNFKSKPEDKKQYDFWTQWLFLRDDTESMRVSISFGKEEEKVEYIKINLQEEENKKRREEIKKIEQIYNSLDPPQQEEIRIETENRLPEFWKERLNKGRAKGTTSKLLEVVLEEKRKEIIKEWIKYGRIRDI
jgi:hypothetical protein